MALYCTKLLNNGCVVIASLMAFFSGIYWTLINDLDQSKYVVYSVQHTDANGTAYQP